MTDTWRTCRVSRKRWKAWGRQILWLGSCWDVAQTCPTWNWASFWPERADPDCVRSCRTLGGYPCAHGTCGCTAGVWFRRHPPIWANHWLLAWTKCWRSLGRDLDRFRQNATPPRCTGSRSPTRRPLAIRGAPRASQGALVIGVCALVRSLQGRFTHFFLHAGSTERKGEFGGMAVRQYGMVQFTRG